MGSRGAIKSPDTFVMGVTHPSKNTRKRQCDTYKWYQDTPNSSLLTPISGISLCIDTLFRCLARVSILGSFSETPKIGVTLVLAPLLGASELPPPHTYQTSLPPLPNPSPTPTIAPYLRQWFFRPLPLPHPYPYLRQCCFGCNSKTTAIATMT